MRTLAIIGVTTAIILCHAILAPQAVANDFWLGFGIGIGSLLVLDHLTYHWYYERPILYPAYRIDVMEPYYFYETGVIYEDPPCTRHWVEGRWGVKETRQGKGFSTFYKVWIPGRWETFCP